NRRLPTFSRGFILRPRCLSNVASLRLTLATRFSYNILFRSFGKFSRGYSRTMANHFSALKRVRQTERREVINQANSTRVRGQIRAFRESLAGKDKKAAQASYRETVSAIDKAIQKGVLHANTAARYKSRLAAQLNKLAQI